MEFFKEVAAVLQNGQQMTLTVRKTGENLAVSIMSDMSGVKDKAVENIVPIVVSGTPEEFEEGFTAALTSSVKAQGLVTNIKEFEESVEAAKKASEMAKKEKDEKDRLRKEFAGYISLAKQNLSENKFVDAKKCLAKASEIKDADKAQIGKLMQEIDEKSGAGNMFGGPVDMSDGKNLVPGKSPASKEAPKDETPKTDEKKDETADAFAQALELDDNENGEEE